MIMIQTRKSIDQPFPQTTSQKVGKGTFISKLTQNPLMKISVFFFKNDIPLLMTKEIGLTENGEIGSSVIDEGVFFR